MLIVGFLCKNFLSDTVFYYLGQLENRLPFFRLFRTHGIEESQAEGGLR